MAIGGSGGKPAGLSPTERAVHGDIPLPELRALLSAWLQDRLGSPIVEVLFRAGRIDAVWGVRLQDGEAVVLKAHRLPLDLDAAEAAMDGQRTLAAAGYPCPLPLAGPDEIDGRVLSAETLMVGDPPDGREPGVRMLLAEGLARHIELLRGHADLVQRAGAGPSWCRYQGGPWPVPHDTIVDLRSPVAGYEWLDTLGRRAADQVIDARADEEVVVGHADWYAGNTVVAGDRLVGTFDWELVADTEAVIAGFASSCFASSSTGGGGLSTPSEAAAFLHDYEQAIGRPMSGHERRAAAAAATWILAFNARWQVALIGQGLADHATIAMVRDLQQAYLTLSWD